MKETHVKDGATRNIVAETSRMPFLMLGLDLPPPPLFKDVMEKNIIPQVCVFLNFLSSSFCNMVQCSSMLLDAPLKSHAIRVAKVILIDFAT